MRWISPGNELTSFTAKRPEGSLITGGGTDTAPILATRVPDFLWSARATINPSPDAIVRLLLRVDDSHWYAVEADERHVRAVARIGQLQQELGTMPW